MKTAIWPYRILRRSAIICSALIQISCTGLLPAPTVVEYDEISHISRIKQDILYRRALERQSPLSSVRQTFLKERYPEGKSSWKVFDILTMSPNSYNLEPTVHLIVDGAVFRLSVDTKESDRSVSISEETETILTADSTEVDVITGYTESITRKHRISYTLNALIIQRIGVCQEVRFRYYAGPDMTTTRLNGWDLHRLQKIMARTE